MNKKSLALIEELKEYFPFDDKLSENDKMELLNNTNNFSSEWAQIVYDYFYSHLDESGNIISLNEFLQTNKTRQDYYKKVEETFIKNLFSKYPPLFFFDVDDTLTDGGKLSQQKIDYIKNYAQKNRIVLTTGKTYDSIKNVIDDLELSSKYASCLNGSVLVKNGEFTTLEKIGAESKKIVEHFKNAPFDLVVYYEDNIRLVKELNEKSLNHLRTYSEAYYKEDKIDYNRVVKVLFFIFDGEDEKEKMVDEYVKNHKDLISLRTTKNTYEILRKTQHKGTTVKKIAEQLNYHYRASIGVGDSMNDSSLLSHVGKPFVVSTASDDLKSFGYEVLEPNRDEDIVNLIKKYTKGENYEQ